MVNIAQLIERCKQDEARSQRVLYERFYGYALKITFRYVSSYDLAINLVNDGFVKVFRSIHKFHFNENGYPERSLMAWLKRIVINTCIDELRKSRTAPETVSIPEWVWEQPDNSRQADRHLLYKELISHIKDLSPSYRTVFNLFVIDGYTHVEIAEQLGITVGTSKSNLSRARNILQKAYLNSAYTFPD